MSTAQDLGFALRIIRKNPWFSAAIVVTLGFGMGINTTVFSLVNAVLFKPLPFEGGDRLIMASASNPSAGRDTVSVSYADFRSFGDAATSFEHLEAFYQQPIDLGEHGNPPERFRGMRVTTGMFDMLRTPPVAGRALQPSDGQPGAAPVLLIGFGVWRTRYSKDLSVIGRAVRANEDAATIVGVMPEGFKFPNNEDIWMPYIPDAAGEKRSNRDFRMIGMLKPGVSIAQASADMDIIAKRLEQEYPDTNKDHRASVKTFHEAMNGGPIRLVFLLMMGAVGFVLLIACANVANMLLARALERTREVSIRAAMGASRWRLVKQLLIESVVLSAMGGVLGILLAQVGIRAFASAVADVGKPYWIDFSMNYVVFGYFAALTLITGMIFGLAPALAASRVNLNDTLKEGSRGSSSGAGGFLSAVLVVFQFTLAVVLLSGAGLMMRSFLVAQNEFSWVHGGQVLATRVTLPQSRYAKPVDRQQFFERLQARLAALPGVQTAALASNAPGDGAAGWRFEIEGRPVTEARQRPAASGVVATRGYLKLLGLPLLRGKDFEETDGVAGRETVIVCQSLVTRYFPNQDPLGKQIRFYNRENKPGAWTTIIGVVPDFRQQNPTEQSTDSVVLVPYRSESYSSMTVLLRTSASPTALAPAVRSEVQQIDQDLPLFDTMSLEAKFYRQRWYLSVFGTVFLVFAAVAMAMAAVGIYAVMANGASRRTREIGVRMALGANERSIMRLVLSRGLKQLAIGMVLGLTVALLVCKLMAKLLFMISPHDPVTFAVVTVALGATGLAAIFFPARRAARLDPLEALRYE